MTKKALIVVDVQNDFCSGGALAVAEGDRIMPTVNVLVDAFKASGDIIVYTKDSHPEDHASFAKNHPDGIWPPHCVQGTAGEAFHPDLKVEGEIFYKAFLTEKDSYSGFGGHQACQQDATSLNDYLQQNSVKDITVVGLALDYCVKSTAIDAQNLGFQTSVILDGTRAVNVNPGDAEKVIAELKAAGVAVK